MSLLASSSGNVKIWMFDGARLDILANSVASTEDTLCVRWNHTNQVVGAGTSDGNIHLQHVNTAQILSTLSLSQHSIAGAVRGLAFSHNSRYLASAARNGIHVWDLKRRTIKASLKGHAGDVFCVGFNAEGQVLSGDLDGVLKLWDVGKNETSFNMHRTGMSASLNCLEVAATSGNGHVACGYGDGALAVWDPAIAAMTAHFPHLHDGPCVGLSMSPKNTKLVVVAGEDGKVHLIDTSSPSSSAPSASIHVGQQLTTIAFQENAIHSAVGTRDGNILMYDWRHLSKPLCKASAHSPAPVLSLAFQVPKARPTSSSSVAGSAGGLSSSSPAPPSSAIRQPPEPRQELRQESARPVPEKAELGNSVRSSAATEPPMMSRTPEKAPVQHTQQAFHHTQFPDASVREEVSDLSFGSAGSVTRRARGSTGLLDKSMAGTASARRVHMDVRTEDSPAREAAANSRNGNMLYTSGSKLDSPLSARADDQRPQSQCTPTAVAFSGDDNYDDLRKRVEPATSQELQEMYQMLRYDVHREVQSVIREQVRQFDITKDETIKMIAELKSMLGEVLEANRELREENERLRRIY